MAKKDQHDAARGEGDTEPANPARKRRRGYGLLIFFLGVIIGAAVATLGPQYARPYLGEAGLSLSPMPTAGTVVEKRLEDQRLLLRVSTDQGVTLAIFTHNLEDIDLLIGQGDSVELGTGRYEPFLHDPAILRVRPSEASTQDETPSPAPQSAGSSGPTEILPGTAPVPDPAGDARVAYERRMEHELVQLEALIAAFERRSTRAGADIGDAARRQLDELNERRATARAKLTEFKAAGANAWQDLRAGLDEAWDDVREALVETGSRFEQDAPATSPTAPDPSPTGPPPDNAPDRAP